MGRLQTVISDDIEKQLRSTLAQRKKGDISKAVEEAIKDWLKKHASR